MKGSKQSKADHQQKQIDAIIATLRNMMGEMENLRNLSLGTLETIKMMPDYQKALSDLMEQNKKENESE
jgi:hypothetical protein